MSYRPYPDRDRALAQLGRGRVVAPPSEFQLHMAEQASAALEAAGRVLVPLARSLRQGAGKAAPSAGFRVGEYHLSTRRA
jgi:hypothetical protein